MPFTPSDSERERLSRFQSQQAEQDFVAAHWLGRQALGAATSTDPRSWTLAQSCRRCGASHGPVHVSAAPRGHDADWHLSLSHSRGVVGAAVARCPVGVDLERRWERHWAEDVADLAYSAAERRLLDEEADPGRAAALARLFWTRKESLVKLGRLSLDTLASTDVSGLPEPQSPLSTHTLGPVVIHDFQVRSCDVAGSASMLASAS